MLERKKRIQSMEALCFLESQSKTEKKNTYIYKEKPQNYKQIYPNPSILGWKDI